MVISVGLGGLTGYDRTADHEKQAERVVKGVYVLLFFNGRNDLETTGGEKDGKREPEPSVGGESGCCERISHGQCPERSKSALGSFARLSNRSARANGVDEQKNIPHARKQLDQSAVSKRQRHHYIWYGHTSGAHVDQAQHEGGQCEGTQTQWHRVSEGALLCMPIQPGFKFASGGGQTRFVVPVWMCGGRGRMILFVSGMVDIDRHVASRI